MNAADVLADLDSRPWAELQHAYGSADDVPGLLRALAGDDAEAAEEALHELYGNVIHQGTVYAATPHAVPYLARLAAAGCRTADLLGLLGDIAESEDEHGVEEGACRAAVAAQLTVLLPLLSAPDAGVRQAAAWAVSHTAADVVLPELRRCWAREREAGVRAELLAALARLDPAGTAAVATAALGPKEPPQVRVIAALVCVDAGLPWTAAHHDTVLSVLPADELVASRFDQERQEPLCHIAEALLLRDTDEGREAACALLEAALRDPRPEARAEALWAADRACTVSRGAPARLLPAIVPLLDEESVVDRVLPVLDKFAPQAASAAPALEALAEGNGDLADRALAVLAVAAPERAAPLLARDLGGRPRALDAVAGFRAPAGGRFPFVPELLEAVRERLAAPDDLGPNEPAQLARLLASWGERAAAALPELRAVLSRFPRAVPGAMAAVCPERKRERVAGWLREAAAMGPAEGRLEAAGALHGLTGELGPLLDALAAALEDGGYTVREAARTAGELGPDAAELVPALRAALSGPGQERTVPRLDGDAEVAAALWRITGEADEAVRVLDGVLAAVAEEPWFRWTGVRAARAAALLGPAARPLRPRLERLLDDPVQAPAAVLALLATVPGDGPDDGGSGADCLDRTALAEAALESAELDADPDTALEALRALGARALSGEHIRRLTALAERDPRVVRSGLEHEVIRADERFRQEARAVLAALA